MSFSALATVEHQLIMQFLPFREIVQLARCSQSLMHAADSPFAFHHAEPIRRPFPEPPRVSSIISPARSCLQHAPFILCWTLPRTDSAADLAAAVDALIAFLAAVPVGHLRGLDAEDNVTWISEAQWKRILACPAAQQIRFLALPRVRSDVHAVSAELIEMLSRLPLLSTLRIGDCDYADVPEPDPLRNLCDLSSLTSFDCSTHYHRWPPEALHSVGRCRHLTSLGFFGNDLGRYGPRLLAGLDHSPLLLTLVQLRAESCYFHDGFVEPFFSVIAQMSQLRELTFAFSSMHRVYKQLPSIATRHPLPATLETFCIQPFLGSDDSQELALLAQMLAALPRLHLVLRIEAHFSSTNTDHVSAANLLRQLYTTAPELAEVRAAGRFRVDWRLRK